MGIIIKTRKSTNNIFKTIKSPLWIFPQRAVIQLLMLIFQLSTGNLHAHDGVGIKHAAANLFKHGEANQTALGGVRRKNRQIRSDGHATKELRLATDIDSPFWHHAAGDDGGTPDTRADTSLQQLSLGIRVKHIPIPLAQVAVVLGVAEDGGNTDVVALDGGETVGEGSGGQVASDVDVLIRGRWVIANSVHDCEDLAVFLCHNLSRAEVDRTLDEVKPTSLDFSQGNLGVGRNLEQGEHDPLGLHDADDVVSFLADDVGCHVGILVIDGESAIGELLDVERLASDGLVVTALTKGLNHGRSNLLAASGCFDVLAKDSILFFK